MKRLAGRIRRARAAIGRRGGVVAIAAVAMTTACSSSSSSAGAKATTTSAASQVASTPLQTSPTAIKGSIASMLKPDEKEVALGSSFASGFGIPVQSTNCGRSSRDYGALIARRFHLSFTDVSCGGAVVPDILNRSQLGHPPQIDAVTKDTKLITVTVGGNDIGYTGKAIQCGDPSTVCTATPTLSSDLARDRAALEQMVSALHAAAPSATIVFVTYPRQVPVAGTCPAQSWTASEAAIVRDMGAKLEQVFVAVFKDSSVVFVDPYSAPGDHTACAPPSQAWMAGHVAPKGFRYHPTALGHEVMAHMVIAALERTKG